MKLVLQLQSAEGLWQAGKGLPEVAHFAFLFAAASHLPAVHLCCCFCRVWTFLLFFVMFYAQHKRDPVLAGSSALCAVHKIPLNANQPGAGTDIQSLLAAFACLQETAENKKY